MKSPRLIAIVMMMATSLCIVAQKPNIKWGKPTQEELTMTTYEKYPEANAVVLHKETYRKMDYVGDGFKLRTHVKCRIKVLKPQGKDYANGTLVYSYFGGNPTGREILETLKAASFNLVDGKVVKTQMTKDMIFHEDISKTLRRTKFTVPQVTEGSVIEYEYSTLSDFYWIVEDWEAQGSIPVQFTYYNLIVPEYFKFNVVETGLRSLLSQHKEGRMTLSMRGATMQCNCGDYNYYGYNLPPLHNEPFCYNPRNYGQKVAAELRALEIPGRVYKNYATTWSNVDMTLLESDDMGKHLNKNPLKDAMPNLANDTTTEQKIVAIYSVLRDKVKWNKSYSLYASDKASNILKNGSGKNSDINLILIAMLRDAGLNAYPVVLRTRDDGLLPFASPSIHALSTFIVGVKDGNKMYYIDGSSEDGYINVLPSILLANKARIIVDEKHADWIDLSRVTNASTVSFISATMQPDGTLTGTRNDKLMGLDAMSMRREYKAAKDSIEFLQNLGKKNNIEITSYSHEGMTQFVPQLRQTFGFTSASDNAGDLIYVKPLVDNILSESPFTDEKREMPIEFPSVSTQSITCKIDIPQGFTIEELPHNLSFKSQDGSLLFKYLCANNGESITTTCQITVSNTFFAPNDYAQVKAFFDEVVKASTEMIVLKKTQE